MEISKIKPSQLKTAKKNLKVGLNGLKEYAKLNGPEEFINSIIPKYEALLEQLELDIEKSYCGNTY